MQAYYGIASKCHENLMIIPAGLYVDIERPYIGASPDRIITCTCCDRGCLEVKCPFCVKDGLSEDDNLCMKKSGDKWTLKKEHSYFYQVQTQLHVCKVDYCDFVMWTEQNVVIERITTDRDFFDSLIEHIEHFFKYGMLPEIIGKWYTRKPIADSTGIVPQPSTSVASLEVKDNEDYERCWCYCNQPSFGTMIGCDNNKCSIEWFHCECLRLRCPPKGKWYCPSCRKLPVF